MRWLILWLIASLPSALRADVAGEFDYYVLSLSWSANWCAIEGDARDSDQCDPRHDHGWILHGLWPQNEDGYPAFCQTAKRPPPRSMTSSMADVMGSPGLAWHQWKKHGTCSGLAAADYYNLSRRAYGQIVQPDALHRLTETYRIAPKVIEDVFLAANADLRADQITVTCRQGHIQEVRICLTRELEPRRCGDDVRRDCSLPNATFTPVR